MTQMTSLEKLRHSAAHIMATAVLRIFPEAKLDIGPPTDTGFYYDFDLNHHFTHEDLEKIEVEMTKIVKENQRFERMEVTREFAENFFKENSQPYKISRLHAIPEKEVVTFYRNSEFTDLCAGTHINYTKQVKAFKLLSVAGTYYRGDENNKQLQRIYGTAFPSKEELENHLAQLGEAKKRDHRKLGRELQLFHINEQVGSGLILWTPRGSIIRNALQEFISEELYKQNYQQVYTPHIGKLGLYKKSGHFPYYSDSQFPPLVEREELELFSNEGCACSELSNRFKTGEIDGYLLKPMNCPMHIKIFDSQPHSYKDLPIRLAEFGTVYRWEQSGELNGMTRVRGFTQDDAHIFCTEDQVCQEIKSCLELVKTVLKTLGMKDYRLRLGLRETGSDKYADPSGLWEKAENALREAAKTLGFLYSEEAGEAAFYGPKIDFVVKDVIGREWQLGTVQVDYNLPERFNLYYTASNNQQCRPVMIHRAPFGSLERFTGLLIEHFAGNFPTWIAPEQVRILTLNDDLKPYADDLLKILKAEKIRASIDSHSDKLGAKIRRSEIMKVPYIFVVGVKEQEKKQVSIRSRISKSNEGNFSIEDALKLLTKEIQERTLPSEL